MYIYIIIIRDGERLARREELENFLGRLEVQLDDRNYQMNPAIRELNHRHIKNIFQRTMITKAEVNLRLFKIYCCHCLCFC
jgi:tRNA C32,U32 (ribose-2'-O)-methylase TrmJ